MAFVFSKRSSITGAEAIFSFKELLKTAGWTVLSSSDGTTYNAAGDQIIAGTSGAGGMANSRAWFRIRSPGGPGTQEFTFQRSTANNQNWRIKRSRTAGFTGGTPGAIQTPSATDEFVFYNTGTDASPVFNSQFMPQESLYRFKAGADNAAPYGFWMGCFPVGGGLPTAGLILDPLFQSHPSDPDPYWIYINGGTPFLRGTISIEVGNLATSKAMAQIISATPGSTYDNYYGLQLFILGTAPAVPDQACAPLISKAMISVPIILVRKAADSNPGFKGITTLTRWLGQDLSTGSTMTVNGIPRSRIAYGDISFPWDGTVPTI